MAASDSFSLILNQALNDLNYYKENIKHILILVGTWYTLHFSVRFGSSFIKWIYNIKQLCVNRNLVKCYGNWAVITGCTSGIGKAFACTLASKGLNVVLISRNGESLNQLAKYIQKCFGVHAIPVVIDFETSSFCSLRLLSKLLKELDVGILVNNVGVHYDYPMEFHHLSEEKIHALLQVNITSAVALTHTVLPLMIKRKKGLIVFMSSAAGSLPYSLISLYSATKSFLVHFSQSLHNEAMKYNIHVQSLVPYYIGTRMVDYSSLLQRSRLLTPSPATYVSSAIRTFGLYQVNTGYFPHTVQSYVQNLFPRSLNLKFCYWLHKYLNQEGIKAEKCK